MPHVDAMWRVIRAVVGLGEGIGTEKSAGWYYGVPPRVWGGSLFLGGGQEVLWRFLFCGLGLGLLGTSLSVEGRWDGSGCVIGAGE